MCHASFGNHRHLYATCGSHYVGCGQQSSEVRLSKTRKTKPKILNLLLKDLIPLLLNFCRSLFPQSIWSSRSHIHYLSLTKIWLSEMDKLFSEFPDSCCLCFTNWFLWVSFVLFSYNRVSESLILGLSRIHCVSQAGFKLITILPQHPKCCFPSCL